MIQPQESWQKLFILNWIQEFLFFNHEFKFSSFDFRTSKKAFRCFVSGHPMCTMMTSGLEANFIDALNDIIGNNINNHYDIIFIKLIFYI